MTKKRKQTKKVRRERGHWRADTRVVPLPTGHHMGIHPALTSITCPDCAAHWEAPEHQRCPGAGGGLEHAPTNDG